MVEKLRSITKKIRWSLVLKAAAVGLSWVYLPEWISVILAVFFYFSSFFRIRHMGVPFLSALIIAHVLGQNIPVGFFLAGCLFLILGLKELVFIDRRSAYMALIFLIFFFASFLLYENLDAWNGWFPVKSLLFAWLFWAFSRGFLLEAGEGLPGNTSLALGALSFVFWEIVTVIAFLPLDFLYQAGIIIFMAFVFFEWLVDYSRSSLVKNKILIYISLLFILVTLIFAFAKWSL